MKLNSWIVNGKSLNLASEQHPAPSTSADLCDGLTESQRTAVTSSPDRPLVLIASAGSGKTRTLTRRIAFLLQQGVQGKNILAIAFTRKAAEEMKARLMSIIDWKLAAVVTVCNFHQLALRILREHYREAGFSQSFTVLGAQDQRRVIHTCIQHYQNQQSREQGRERVQLTVPDNCRVDTDADDDDLVNSMLGFGTSKSAEASTSPEVSSSTVDYFTSFIRKAKRKLQRPCDFVLEHRAIYELYVDHLRQQNAIDFSDMIPLTTHLLTKRALLLEHYRQLYSHILVDEYQDVSKDQFDLLRLLAVDGHITAVGDDDQSIYGWRGSSVRSFELLEDVFDRPHTILLEENFRSTANILRCSQALIERNVARRKKVLRTANALGERVKLLVSATPSSEGVSVATEILRRRSKQGLRWADFAVLSRTNHALRGVSVTLKENGVPVRLVTSGKRSAEKTKEVQDLLAYVELLTSSRPSDEAFERVCNVPKRNIGKTSVNALKETAALRRISLVQVCSSPSALCRLGVRQRDALAAFSALLSRMRRKIASLSAPQALATIIEAVDYISFIDASSSNDLQRGERKANLGFLTEFVASDAAPDELLGSVVQRIGDQKRVDSMQQSPDFVTVSTVHQAKGREWPVVFVVRFTDSHFPLSFREESQEGVASDTCSTTRPNMELAMSTHLEEERRLVFVALTRACHTLVLSFSRTDASGNAVVPSRFLDELPADALERVQRALPTDAAKPKESSKESSKAAPKASGSKENVVPTKTSPSAEAPTPLPPRKRRRPQERSSLGFSSSSRMRSFR